MSDLELHAKPVVGPLLNDVSFSLDSSQQSALAQWSVKTAMVFEATDRSRDWFYSAADRQGLSASVFQIVPGYGLVDTCRATSCVARRGSCTSIRRGVKSVRRRPRHNSCNSAARHSSSHGAAQARVRGSGTGGTQCQRGPWESLLSQIWPTETARVKWPPGMSFDDSGISFPELSGRFAVGRRP